MRKMLEMRRVRGEIFTEMALLLPLVIASTVLAVNAAIPSYAGWWNDAACRDAARAASTRSNAESAKRAARKALIAFKVDDRNFFSTPKLGETATEFQFVQKSDEEDPLERIKGSFVRVTTTTEARLMAPLHFTGREFTDRLTFKRSYTYPLAKTLEDPPSGPAGSDSDADEADPDVDPADLEP